MLRTRFITAMIAGLIAIGLMLWGPLPWTLWVWAGTVVGVWEYGVMLGVRRFSPLMIWGWLATSVMLWWFPAHLLLLLPAVVGVAMVWPVVSRNQVTVTVASSVGIGILYLGYGGGSLAAVRALPHGLVWVSYLLISVWLTDTVAYFAGKRFGGRKLWPTISPKKTISGAVAGVCGAALGALVWGVLMLGSQHWPQYLLGGALLSVTGELGDLVESAYKRSAGVKDSGSVFPGHGGMLDRVDSLFFAAPVLYFLVAHGFFNWPW